MEKGVWIAIFIVSLVILGGVVYNFGFKTETAPITATQPAPTTTEPTPTTPTTPTTETPTTPTTTTPSATAAKTVTVEMISSGFSPSSVEINKGDTVVFLNKNTADRWPASASHPTHTVYPESGGCVGSKFDACGRIAPGQSFTFTFNQEGSWGYHDHLNPSLRGTIVVK